MRSLLFVIVLVLVGVATLGYCRGWFGLSTASTDNRPSATITVDEDKFHEDEQKAKEKVQDFGQEAKQKTTEWTGTAKEPDSRP